MAGGRERERQLARERYERQQARRRQQHRQARNTGVIAVSVIAIVGVIGAIVALFLVSGTSGSAQKKAGGSSGQPTPAASPSGAPSALSASPGASTSASASGSATAAGAGPATAANGTCSYTKAGPASKNVGIPPATPVSTTDIGVRLQLGQGLLQGVLYGSKAPCTVNSFVYLAEKNYFTGTKCHRLTTQGIYVLQCGDPTGTGSGGPGYEFPDENLAGLGTKPNAQATYPAGTLAMANAGPGTNGSQFFIVYKDSPLAASYTPFGKITKGMDIVQQIAAKGTDNANGTGDGHPKQPVTIQAVTILQ